MTLAQALLGKLVTISSIGGERAFRRRLMELGLVPGTRVELKGFAPLGDPMELLVRGCSISIRRAEAEHVHVLAPEGTEPVGIEVPTSLARELDARSVT